MTVTPCTRGGLESPPSRERGLSSPQPMPLAESMTRAWQGQTIIPAFQSILGDPTLRLFRVNPPQNVRKASNGLTVSLWWDPATESGTGYHVYRTTSANGVDSSVQATTTKLSGTSYTETLTTAGSYTYIVRATKLQTSGSGSFWNLSQGTYITATVP